MPDLMVTDTTRAMTNAVAPVFLISGVSVLLGSMTVRYGRVIDRARTVLKESQDHAEKDPRRERDARELKMLYRRARLLRLTIILAAMCIFCIALTIFLLFANFLFHWSTAGAVAFLFIGSLVFLIIAVALFIEDFAISLGGLKFEINTRFSTDLLKGER